MRRRLLTGAVLGWLMLAVPVSASAATISREIRPVGGLAIYYDGDAQDDEFTVSNGPMNTIVFTQDSDGEAALVAGNGCDQEPPQGSRTVVSCAGFINIRVAAGGGDDSLKGFSTTGAFCV